MTLQYCPPANNRKSEGKEKDKNKNKLKKMKRRQEFISLKKFRRPSFVGNDDLSTTRSCTMKRLNFQIPVHPLAFSMLNMKDWYFFLRDYVFIVNIWVNRDFLPCFEQVHQLHLILKNGDTLACKDFFYFPFIFESICTVSPGLSSVGVKLIGECFSLYRWWCSIRGRIVQRFLPL